MAIKYLAGERIIGTAAERAAMTTAQTYSSYVETPEGALTNSGGNINAMMVSLTETELSTNDVIGSIGIKLYATTNQPYGGAKWIVYSNSGGSPTTLRGHTGDINPLGTGWIDFPMATNYTMTANEKVWIGFWAAGGVKYYSNSSPSIHQQDTLTYVAADAPPTTFTDDTTHGSCMFARVGIVDTPAVYPNLPNGTIFEESDTGKHYMWDGTSAWNEMT